MSDESLGQPTKDEEPAQPAASTAGQKRSLFVHSLPASATTENLTKFFSQSYPLKHATVVSDPTSNQSKGYGFVTFADPSDASAALQTFNDSLFEGKRIKVEHAEPRSRGPHPDNSDVRTAAQSSPATLQKGQAPRGRQQSLDEPLPQLIIRNLPWSIGEPEQLAMLFRSYGKVKRANVPKKGLGLSAGFGFVLLRGRKNAEKALAGLNGKIVDGRPLAVDWAVRKGVWESLHQKKASDVGKEGSVGNGGSGEKTSSPADPESEDSVSDGELPQEEDRPDAASPEERGESTSFLSEAFVNRRSEEDHSSTLFVRNVPFTITDESLSQHFASFGNLRYARIVRDSFTGRSKGTAFVCFVHEKDAVACLRAAPRAGHAITHNDKSQGALSVQSKKKSILEDVNLDHSGQYTLEGRMLHLSRAVDKGEAARLTAAGHTFRDVRDKDKRRLYLLGEGTISSNTPLYGKLSPSEIALREESARQRQSLIKTNPSLHLSLTRLSVRNLPRGVTSKDLKALAREAVVGFSRDVKAGLRRPLSKEENSRAGDMMREAERVRKVKGKGIVKQSKVVFEGKGGGKVAESSGAGRSKGYGFIEYTSHRWALMGLRWLNGHAVGAKSDGASKSATVTETKKRLIVEFAIENAQVVNRRQEREGQSQGKERPTRSGMTTDLRIDSTPHFSGGNGHTSKKSGQTAAKRKRPIEKPLASSAAGTQDDHMDDAEAMERSAKKQRIIGRKRMARKARKPS
ncbi:MAG: hypothetical protein L6R39_002836 [Caloplaca ligustica]|nr:MAG: hypothetical protein L6R39_002836 [Caloplaca ligustica]